jgi:hypothetical protein
LLPKCETQRNIIALGFSILFLYVECGALLTRITRARRTSLGAL